MVKLVLYKGEEEITLGLIKGFWYAHNQYLQTDLEAQECLETWTSSKDKFYFISYNNQYIGFVHLGSRGADIDWLEDIFVMPEYQRRGIATKAIALVEEIVKEYSVSLYIEVAARNEAALRLYKRLGYDSLNTITIRKDFPKHKYNLIKKETILGLDFEIRKTKIK